MDNNMITDKAYQFVLERFIEEQKFDNESNAGGKIRKFSGETVEQLTCLIWEMLAKKHNKVAKVIKGTNAPIRVSDNNGNYIEESVDQHCYIGDKLVVAIEDKTYLDKCYLQRADSDFALMKEGANESFAAVIFSLENSIKDTSYNFFMGRGNVDRIFFFADGKRNSTKGKRIYNNPDRLNRNYIQDAVEYLDSFFIDTI